MKGNVYMEQILLAAMRCASRPLSYFFLLLQFVLRLHFLQDRNAAIQRHCSHNVNLA